MTPQGLTLLGLILAQLRDWLEDTDPGSLDGALIDAAIDAVGRARRALVEDGAR